MATIKLRFRASTKEDKEGALYYQIIHNRVVRQINTEHRIGANEWDEDNSKLIIHSLNPNRRSYLESIDSRINLDMGRITQIISALNRSGKEYSANDVVTTFRKRLAGVTLFDFMQGVIARLTELRKYRTSETYKTTLNSFMKFRGGEDILLTDISADVILDYEARLIGNGLTMNTVSFYMRILRAVYNRAIEKELVEQSNPFKKVYTGVDKTVKRALSLDDIRKIKEVGLPPELMFARDMFLFSFYTRGMSFVDMAYLRKRDLNNGVITYRRRKTGKQLHIKWEGCMQEILDRYPMFDTEYLLPIITDRMKDDRKQYRNALSSLNKRLKKIGAIVGLSTPLTHYVARHSWASVAKSNNIPISVISEGMGHDSETTTQIYLASLDTSIVDNANNLILKLL